MPPKPKKSVDEHLQSAKNAIDLAWSAYRMLLAAGQAPQGKDVEYESKPAFGNFATENQGFREEVQRLRELLLDYATRTRVDRPLNILLAAAPGTGKSFLAKELGRALSKELKEKKRMRQDVVFEEVHVAAFRSPDDLQTVLQRVQSANLKGNLPFVLFDEVDGEVAGSHMVANFLAPMWDGKFYVGSDSYAIGPAIFCFAASRLVPSPTVEDYYTGSGVPRTPASNEPTITYASFAAWWHAAAAKAVEGNTPIPKARDFLDRIDVMLCMPPVHIALLGAKGLADENLGLTLSWVRKHFPNVTRVEKAAVAVLGKKLLLGSRRDAERSIFIARSPDTTTFDFKMLPERDRRQFGEDVKAEEGKYYRFKRS